MDVLRLIKEVKTDKVKLQCKVEELERLETLCHVSGVSYEGDRVTGSTDNSRIEKAYLKYIEVNDNLKEFISKHLEERKLLVSILDMLDKPKDIEVMYQYCLTDMSLKDVGDKLGYSKPSVHKIYKNSVKVLQEKVDESIQK